MENGSELFGSTYQRGETVFRQGDPGDAMYIIQSGAVEVAQQKNGREVVIAILEKGDFFGEMAILQNETRSATVTAISHTRLIPLSKTLLIDRLKRDPDVSLHLLRRVIQRIRSAHRRYRQELLENEAFRNAVAALSEKVLSGGRAVECIEPDDAVPQTGRLISDLFFNPCHDSLAPYRQNAVPGEIIFHEGENGDSMYLIVGGSVGISKNEGNAPRLIDTIGPGDFFGEMAVIADMPRSATVTALEPTELIAIDKKRFLNSLQNQPELAIAIIQTLILRLSYLENILANPGEFHVQQYSRWLPRLHKQERLSLSIVSLSTCAGCSAVLLDEALLSEVLSKTSIEYCQMLMDREHLPESDIILVDGIVRLREDQERLNEARRKCRYLVAWGTCASFSGIPGLANRFEVESVVEESYGSTEDALSYYFSGAAGVDQSSTYQLDGIELHRRAFAVDSFEKIDFYLPGCPPPPSLLLHLLGELTGSRTRRMAPIVCSDCIRKRTGNKADSDSGCFNAAGIICLGFMTRGGCDAICPNSQIPCWGCRGPSKKTIRGLQQGATFEEIASLGFRQRCPQTNGRRRKAIKHFRHRGHFMFNMNSDAAEKWLRVR